MHQQAGSTWLSESQTILCVSNTSMSISAVFPWCKWPTTATFRTNSGNAVMFSRKLYTPAMSYEQPPPPE